MQGRIKQRNNHINWITKKYRNSNPRITKNEWFETKNKTQLGHWKKVMINKEVDKPIHPRDKEQNLNIKQFHNLKRNINSKTRNPGSTTGLGTSGLDWAVIAPLNSVRRSTGSEHGLKLSGGNQWPAGRK